MLSFKKIEQSDINELKKYYDYDECMGCDTNLLNAYLWRNEYNIKFAFYDDTIVKVYCNPDESVWGYCMPTGKNIKGALEEVFKDAEERNGNLRIVMLTNGNRAMLETMLIMSVHPKIRITSTLPVTLQPLRAKGFTQSVTTFQNFTEPTPIPVLKLCRIQTFPMH